MTLAKTRIVINKDVARETLSKCVEKIAQVTKIYSASVVEQNGVLALLDGSYHQTSYVVTTGRSDKEGVKVMCILVTVRVLISFNQSNFVPTGYLVALKSVRFRWQILEEVTQKAAEEITEKERHVGGGGMKWHQTVLCIARDCSGARCRFRFGLGSLALLLLRMQAA